MSEILTSDITEAMTRLSAIVLLKDGKVERAADTCPKCGCSTSYPTAVHIVCGEVE